MWLCRLQLVWMLVPVGMLVGSLGWVRRALRARILGSGHPERPHLRPALAISSTRECNCRRGPETNDLCRGPQIETQKVRGALFSEAPRLISCEHPRRATCDMAYERLAAIAGLAATGILWWLHHRRTEREREALRAELTTLRQRLAALPPAERTANRSWKSQLAGVDKMVSELLCEARLLASELNTGGDPMAIVRDPLVATVTLERTYSTPSSEQSSESRGPGAVREMLGQFEPGTIETKVIGVCGMSCSGKSTVSSVLRAFAKGCGSYVPVICLDDSYHAWMNDQPSRDQRTNYCPPGTTNGRAWKNWESKDCVNWQGERVALIIQ